jgi:hypothetical protein
MKENNMNEILEAVNGMNKEQFEMLLHKMQNHASQTAKIYSDEGWQTVSSSLWQAKKAIRRAR